MFLLNATLGAIFENATLSKARVNVANDKLPADEQARLKKIATALGLNFDETKFTFIISQSKTKGRQVFDVQVANKNGQPTLFWGEAEKLLSECPVTFRVEAVGEKFQKSYLAFDILPAEGSDDDVMTLYLPMSLETTTGKDGKTVYPETATIRNALFRKTLSQLLKERSVFIQPEHLKTIEESAHKVIAFHYTERFDSYSVQLENGTWIKANTAMKRKLSANPVISEKYPAQLTVGKGSNMSNGKEVDASDPNGRYIIPVTLLTAADLGTLTAGETIQLSNGVNVPVLAF